MDLERIAIVLRPRPAWEAIDLGFAMARRWFGPLWLSWWCGAIPIYLLATILLPESDWLVPALVVWWCKPLYEPPLLYRASRAMFGDLPGRSEMLRRWPAIVGPRLISNLTWRRFNPYRSFHMAVSVLERQRGRRHRDRVLLLGRNQHAAAWLTVFGLLFETIIDLSIILLVIIMIPEELRWSDAWTLTLGANEFSMVLGELAALAGMSLMAPFYVCGGFSLYINRRSVLEGWDIELGFRRIVARRAGRFQPATAAVSVCALVVMLVSAALSGPAVAGQAPDRETARAVIEEVLNDPDFGREKTETYWHYVGGDEQSEEDDEGGPFAGFAKWLLEVIAGFFKGVAAVAEALLWVAAGVALAFVIAWAIKNRPPPRKRSATGPRGGEHGFRLFNLDIAPETLPADVPSAALSLVDRGDLRGALSLLYRGMLARFVRDKLPDIPPGATEGECVALVRRVRSAGESDYFGRLTREWIRLAYAHRPPEPATVRSLCTRWRGANDDAGG